jgi:hypothetical protein
VSANGAESGSAPYKTVDGKSDAGAAHVFTRSGKTWSQQAELSDPHAAYADLFGSSVALSGSTALIGAEGKSVSGQLSAGTAYVVVHSSTSWSQQAELSASDGTAYGDFGCSVALSADTALIGTH